MKTRGELRLAGWLTARGWRRGLNGFWRHDTLSPTEDLTGAEALRAQTHSDRAHAEEDRNRDIQAADRGADEAWRQEALSTIQRVAMARAEFTTDDVLEANPALEEAREPRALGPMMLYAARDGLIEPTERYASSSRRQSNARHKRVWRSLIVGGGGAQPERTANLDVLEVVR